MPRKAHWNRCDRCGRFASGQHMQLYTLYGVDHPHAEDVAICGKCSEELETDHAKAITWLDERFPSQITETS